MFFSKDLRNVLSSEALMLLADHSYITGKIHLHSSFKHSTLLSGIILGLGYLKDHLLPATSTQPTGSEELGNVAGSVS